MTIGEKAFSDCANLASIMIPNSVEKIGSNAFYRCNALADVNGLIIVRDVLYGCCKPCENIEIPVGVTKIDSRAFAWDNRIRRIVIPNSVRCIGDSAFELCENLSELLISGDVEHIGKSAFSGCRALADENGLVIVQNTVYSYCGYTEDRITIPEGIVAIDNVAFFERDIHSVLIPSSVESIGTLAFGRCEFLKQIVLPKSRIADLNCHVFSRCKAAVLATDSDSVSFWAYSTKENSDNFTDFVQTGKLRKYDLELINNGPVYKYTMPARLLGMLGRVLEPIDLSESTIQIFMEYLTKNAKKLVPIAEEFRCPEIIKAAYENGIINSKNEKAIRKLLAESKVPRIAALTDYHCN